MSKYKLVLKDTNPDIVAKLIKDEEDAINAYAKAIEEARKTGDEASIARYQHILDEEMEHIQELKDLLANNPIRDSKFKDSKKTLKDWDDLEFERDGERDDQYIVLETAREGYGIDQVEKFTMTVGELISELSNYDGDTKVVFGNDFRGGSFYTYGSVDGHSIHQVTIVEPEDIDYEDEEEED